MGDLERFLTARLDEDEATAREAFGDTGKWHRRPDEHFGTAGHLFEGGDPEVGFWSGTIVVYDEGSPTDAEFDHIARFDPARALREVEAKRSILAGQWGGPDHYEMWDHHVRLLAAVYDDHPDYRAEDWKP